MYIHSSVYLSVGSNLLIGETTAIEHCKQGKAKLYVTRTEDRLLAYCHHCGGKGSHKLGSRGVGVKEITKTDSAYPMNYTLDINKWQKWAVVWVSKAGFSQKDIINYGLGYSKEFNVVVLPVRNAGVLVGYQYRHEAGGSRKYSSNVLERSTVDVDKGIFIAYYISYGVIKKGRSDSTSCCLTPSMTVGDIDSNNSSLPLEGGENTSIDSLPPALPNSQWPIHPEANNSCHLVIVEDILSAIRIHMTGKYSAIALLGVNPKGISNLTDIINLHDHVIIFLDNDNHEVKRKQVQLRDAIELYTNVRTSIHHTQGLDPKEMSNNQLLKELQQYN